RAPAARRRRAGARAAAAARPAAPRTRRAHPPPADRTRRRTPASPSTASRPAMPPGAAATAGDRSRARAASRSRSRRRRRSAAAADRGTRRATPESSDPAAGGPGSGCKPRQRCGRRLPESRPIWVRTGTGPAEALQRVSPALVRLAAQLGTAWPGTRFADSNNVAVRVRIKVPPREKELDGISLDHFRAGTVRDVSATVAAWLIAQGYAEPEMRRAENDDLEYPGTARSPRATVNDRRPRRRSTDH